MIKINLCTKNNLIKIKELLAENGYSRAERADSALGKVRELVAEWVKMFLRIEIKLNLVQ